ncbi:13789_t:CDS:2 [Acaulospora morrowiae]|uniref:13789_t:CDS:1 n=1 Tax=Acaulospora morrowiae TaxID=94023 RepID=A0A9N8ZFP9_9GLOM|nr:13789_t:CDS:2 [Acaulospora morrowiae]
MAEKPSLQRYVVRIIIMVPIYAISSWISLASTNAAFYVDGIRDVYEAFVIYCFFNLLINYLGGERALLILLHGRPPTPHLFPVNIFIRNIDIGDPYAFLFLKRGILQYVYLKPILAVVTMILKWSENYGEGHIEISNEDLRPYRPIPKFLCVKAIIFFSFWQGFALSILVYFGIIRDSGMNTAESISVSIQDFLITFEMLIAAMAHWYAFSYKDYIDSYGRSGRMPIKYAFKDCMGFRDVIEDTLQTIRGSRFNYRTFEPAEGMAYIGPSRTARIMAGLRFKRGGESKYWLPGPNSHTPLLSEQRDDDSNSLYFRDPDPEDEIEKMYENCRRLGRYGDYNFPVIYTNEYGNSSNNPPKPVRKETMSRRKQKGKNKVHEIYTENDNMESGSNTLYDDPNISPLRTGCIDLVKEVSDGNKRYFKVYSDAPITQHATPASIQPYTSVLLRDPFIQSPTSVGNSSQSQIINEIRQENDDDIDDSHGENHTNYLSNSMKSLEKNIWSDDIWK